MNISKSEEKRNDEETAISEDPPGIPKRPSLVCDRRLQEPHGYETLFPCITDLASVDEEWMPMSYGGGNLSQNVTYSPVRQVY
jgi:hypothetical protein